MNLLLLLSALLSALTGVGGNVRAQFGARQVAEGSVSTVRLAPVQRAAVRRPFAGLPPLSDVARTGLEVALVLAAVEPAFARRRRE